MTHPRILSLRGEILGKHSSRGPKPFDARTELTIRSVPWTQELWLKKRLRPRRIASAKEPFAQSGVVYALEG
jgi:hypothetical protein